MARRQTASQRVYRRLKLDILCGGLEPGHIDIQRLADRLRVSPTPVRECLARLRAEQLVTFAPGEGYVLLRPTAAELRTLYTWALRLVHLALAEPVDPSVRPLTALADWESLPSTPALNHARDISNLHKQIGYAQGNEEIAREIAQANDRLFLARTREYSTIPRAHKDVEGLVELWRARQIAALRDTLSTFYATRVSLADLVAAALAAEPRPNAGSDP